MIFTTTSVLDNGSGCAYCTKEKFFEEISAMIDDCIVNSGTHFDSDIVTDVSCYSICYIAKSSEELKESI